MRRNIEATANKEISYHIFLIKQNLSSIIWGSSSVSFHDISVNIFFMRILTFIFGSSRPI